MSVVRSSVGVSSPTKDSLLPALVSQAKQQHYNQHYTLIIRFALCGYNTVEMEQCSSNMTPCPDAGAGYTPTSPHFPPSPPPFLRPFFYFPHFSCGCIPQHLWVCHQKFCQVRPGAAKVMIASHLGKLGCHTTGGQAAWLGYMTPPPPPTPSRGPTVIKKQGQKMGLEARPRTALGTPSHCKQHRRQHWMRPAYHSTVQ